MPPSRAARAPRPDRVSGHNKGKVVPGFRFSGRSVGIKRNGDPDLALLVADRPVACAGVFTTNRIVAAPVTYSRDALLDARGLIRAVVVNSGNANACTGESGERAVGATVEAAAKALGCSPGEVLVCSTGVIGAPLPIDALVGGMPAATEALEAGGIDAFARAIMTTDTRPKVRSASAEIAGRTVRVAGASKGAGMIHPNMATMLGFVVTDAPVDPLDLEGLWHRVCHRTFNAITIDGDTSTNDTALLFASGDGDPLKGDALTALTELVQSVAAELAIDIVRDAEGGTKTVAITVGAAASVADAAAAAEAIATSPLVKTALYGEDPNWGRIIAAAGRSGAKLDPQRLSLWIGDVRLYGDGGWLGSEAEAAARAVMKTAEYPIRLELGGGEVERTLYTCDLGPDYIRINADYRS